MTFGILEYLIGTKFKARKCSFRALSTVVSRKFEHWLISQKVRGNIASFIIVFFSIVLVVLLFILFYS